jgi:hypothetical protein
MLQRPSAVHSFLVTRRTAAYLKDLEDQLGLRSGPDDTSLRVLVASMHGVVSVLAETEIDDSGKVKVVPPEGFDNNYGAPDIDFLSEYEMLAPPGDPHVFGDPTGDWDAVRPTVDGFEPKEGGRWVVHQAIISVNFGEDEDETPGYLSDAFFTHSRENFIRDFGHEADFELALEMFDDGRRSIKSDVYNLRMLAYINGKAYVTMETNGTNDVFDCVGNVQAQSYDWTGGFLTVDYVFLNLDEFMAHLNDERLQLIRVMGAAWGLCDGRPPVVSPADVPPPDRRLVFLARGLCLRRLCRIRGVDAEGMRWEVVEPFAREIVLFL